MKKIFSILFLLLFGMSLNANAQPADRAAGQVVALSQAVKALGNYTVRFTVSVGEHKVSGNYTVGSDRYALTLGDVKVYGDTQTRHEIDTSRKEVVIDKVDTASHNLLSNPLSAFDFIGDEYMADMLSEQSDRVVVRLTPRQKSEQSGIVEVAIDRRTNLPRSITYHPLGESIGIDIDHIGVATAEPEKFDATKYKDFEIIDFR